MAEMKQEVHVHFDHSDALEAKIDKILKNQETLMATVDELKTELSEINATTDELAADVAELLTKVDDPAKLDEVKAGLVAVKDRLKGVASQYPPVPPPVDPARSRR